MPHSSARRAPSQPTVSTLNLHLHSWHVAQAPPLITRPQDQARRSQFGPVCPLAGKGGKSSGARPRPSTHEFLVVVIGEEHLEPRGPVVPPPQQPVGALVPTHVAVPGVFLDGCLGSPWPHQEIHTLHAKAPGRKPSAAEGLSSWPVLDRAWLGWAG